MKSQYYIPVQGKNILDIYLCTITSLETKNHYKIQLRLFKSRGPIKMIPSNYSELLDLNLSNKTVIAYLHDLIMSKYSNQIVTIRIIKIEESQDGKVKSSGVFIKHARKQRRYPYIKPTQKNLSDTRILGNQVDVAKSIAFIQDFNITQQHFEIPENYIKYEVFYGTNRVSITLNKKIKYSSGRDNILHIGECIVSIPLSHQKGELERPNWFEDLFFGESPKKHFTILEGNEMTKEVFISRLQDKIGKSQSNDFLIFIHGFNVKFDDAIMRTAQLGYDLNFKGQVASFSWPSQGKLNGYITDMDSARLSSKFLIEFIDTIMKTPIGKIHIIAHSMGNVVLSDTLIKLKNENKFPNAIINQIILAAPDLDKDIFLQEILPQIKGGNGLTLYSSKKDLALKASMKVRSDFIRLGGASGEDIVVEDGMDSIDASSVNTNLLGHGYFSDTIDLLHDIYKVIIGLKPIERDLDKKTKADNKKYYWAFRKP